MPRDGLQPHLALLDLGRDVRFGTARLGRIGALGALEQRIDLGFESSFALLFEGGGSCKRSVPDFTP